MANENHDCAVYAFLFVCFFCAGIWLSASHKQKHIIRHAHRAFSPSPTSVLKSHVINHYQLSITFLFICTRH